MSTLRGCPPRGLCFAGGMSGSTMAHCSSVRSEGYFFRAWSFFHIRAHSSADGTCANYLTNILFCQALFPDSLSVLGASFHIVATSRANVQGCVAHATLSMKARNPLRGGEI